MVSSFLRDLLGLLPEKRQQRGHALARADSSDDLQQLFCDIVLKDQEQVEHSSDYLKLTTEAGFWTCFHQYQSSGCFLDEVDQYYQNTEYRGLWLTLLVNYIFLDGAQSKVGEKVGSRLLNLLKDDRTDACLRGLLLVAVMGYIPPGSWEPSLLRSLGQLTLDQEVAASLLGCAVTEADWWHHLHVLVALARFRCAVRLWPQVRRHQYFLVDSQEGIQDLLTSLNPYLKKRLLAESGSERLRVVAQYVKELCQCWLDVPGVQRLVADKNVVTAMVGLLRYTNHELRYHVELYLAFLTAIPLYRRLVATLIIEAECADYIMDEMRQPQNTPKNGFSCGAGLTACELLVSLLATEMRQLCGDGVLDGDLVAALVARAINKVKSEASQPTCMIWYLHVLALVSLIPHAGTEARQDAVNALVCVDKAQALKEEWIKKAVDEALCVWRQSGEHEGARSVAPCVHHVRSADLLRTASPSGKGPQDAEVPILHDPSPFQGFVPKGLSSLGLGLPMVAYNLEDELARRTKSVDEIRLILRQHLPELNPKDLDEDTQLGEGSFGKVFRALWRTHETQTSVAVKRMHWNARDVEDFAHEIQKVASVKHENVVQCVGFTVKEGDLCLITEYMEIGSLHHLLTSKFELDGKFRLQVAKDVAAGMLHLHHCKMLHMDLKSPNLLLDRNFRVKVSDFGHCQILRRSRSLTRDRASVGTWGWTAPEVFDPSGNSVTRKSDVYSYGVVLWELITRKEPWGECRHVPQIIVKLLWERQMLDLSEVKIVEVRELISACLSFNPEARPDFQQIQQQLNHLTDLS